MSAPVTEIEQVQAVVIQATQEVGGWGVEIERRPLLDARSRTDAIIEIERRDETHVRDGEVRRVEVRVRASVVVT